MKSTSRAITFASFVGPFLVAALFPIAALAQAVAASYTTGHWYDIAGRLTGTVEPCVAGVCPATRYDYNAAGLLSEEDDGALSGWPANAPSQWTFSSLSRIVTHGYDTMGRVAWTEVSTAALAPIKLTEYSYDQVGRVECVATRMNPTAGPTGNACALTAQGSADRITYTTYNPQDHPVDIYRGYLSPTSQHYAHYTYWPNGMEAGVTDANGNLTSFVYDGLDRLSATQYPSTTTGAGTSQATDEEQCTSYDKDNNCQTRVTRDNQSIQYSYDALNRITSKAAPNEQSVYYGYNLRNQRLYANFGSAAGEGVANAYDGFGEMTSEAVNLSGTARTISYQYDADGDRTRVTYPDGIYIQYSDDGLDRLQTVLQNGSTNLATYSYDGDGRLGELSRAGGLAWTTYGYDGISRLNSLAHTFSSPANDVTYSLQYNADDQIESDTISNAGYAVLATGSQSYTANGLNEYSAVGGTNFGYDGRGNLTADASYSYAYDVENRLTGSSLNSAVLAYDPLGRLYEVSSSSGATTFLYDGDRITAEYNGSGAITNRYVYGVDGDDPIVWYQGTSVASPQYLFADHEGSIVAVTGSSGSVVAINQYDSYGQGGTSSKNQGRFQFTGQAYIPDLNQYYYKARMYSPSLGRFMQTDPIGYTDDLDLYAYVGNDPMDRTDPTGLATYDYYPNGTIVVTQEFDNHSQFSDSDIEAQAAKYNGVTSDGHKLVVVFTPGTDKGSVSIATNKKLDDTSESHRSNTNGINGRKVEIAPNAVGAITVGHEMGHTMGAGDQYKGGIDANGKPVKQDVPKSEGSIMRDYGGRPANTQTRNEIENNATRPNNTVRRCTTQQVTSCAG